VRLQLHGLRFCYGPFKRFRLREQAEFCGTREIQFQAAAIFLVKKKVDVVAQVRFERRLRQFEFAGRIKTDFGNSRQTEIAGSKKVGGDFRAGNVSPGRPDREDGG
jgi:hypothetical protein